LLTLERLRGRQKKMKNNDMRYEKNRFYPGNKIYLLIIAVLIAALFILQHIMIGIVCLIIYSFLIVYNIINTSAKKGEWKKFVENFYFQMDSATRSCVIDSPFPFIMLSETGKVIWYNKHISNLIKEEEILEKDITQFITEINVNKIKDGTDTFYKFAKFLDKYYNVYTTVVDNVNDEDRSIILIYLCDVMETKILYDNRECVVLIEVDNLDDILKTVEERKRPLLAAEIEGAINSYGESINCMIKKYSSNKYVMSVQYRFIEEETKKKFDILDTIREINTGNKLAVTVSIGIGIGGETPQENHKYAVSAQELAQGRGGDQVVIKNNEKLSFFGGKTKEVEKRTRVRARVVSHALKELISESSNVFIMGHKNIDIDSFGAAIGLNSTFDLIDKEHYIILEGNLNGIKQVLERFKEDPKYDETFIGEAECKQKMNDNSLLILVDVHNKGYVMNSNIVKNAKRIVIIDHHRKAADYIENTLLSYMEPYASSTSELVTEILQYMFDKPKLSRLEAEVLLAGICVDTKNFYFKTGVRTFEAAAILRQYGADTTDIKRLFTEDLDTYINRAEIIKSAIVENGVAVAVCNNNIYDSILIAQAADELLNITGTQASFVIAQIDRTICISGRSLGDINVQLILEDLGGGGHMTMAAARIDNEDINSVVNRLRESINQHLMEGEKL
jgi:c-di-AMP phosphodiesterase-like protein